VTVKLDPALLEMLACPACHAPLRVEEQAGELVCTSATCGLAYPVRDDIPVLLIDEARRPDRLTDPTPVDPAPSGDAPGSGSP
jgi:uncharacterized protein YbaR (Trm112 family)